jgi:hypothetical protein
LDFTNSRHVQEAYTRFLKLDEVRFAFERMKQHLRFGSGQVDHGGTSVEVVKKPRAIVIYTKKKYSPHSPLSLDKKPQGLPPAAKHAHGSGHGVAAALRIANAASKVADCKKPSRNREGKIMKSSFLSRFPP